MAEPVAEHYDAPWGYRKLDAERYERRRCGSLGRGLNLRLLKRALTRALARDPAAGLVLDAPCGTGVLSTFLRRKGYGVIGPDISPTMLERTAKCNPPAGDRRGAGLAGEVPVAVRSRLGGARADMHRSRSRFHLGMPHTISGCPERGRAARPPRAPPVDGHLTPHGVPGLAPGRCERARGLRQRLFRRPCRLPGARGCVPSGPTTSSRW